MAKELEAMRVAIIVASDFEQKEFTEPRKALQEAGRYRGDLTEGRQGTGHES